MQLNKANASDTESPFLDLHLSIYNGFVSFNIYDTRDDFGWPSFWKELLTRLNKCFLCVMSICNFHINFTKFSKINLPNINRFLI